MHAHTHCPVAHRLRCIHDGESQIPIALFGCLNQSSPISVLILQLRTLLHACDNSVFSFVSCKLSDWLYWETTTEAVSNGL